MLKFKCPSCGVERKLPDDVKNKKFFCPGCNLKIRHLGEDWFELMDTVALKKMKPPPPGGAGKPKKAT